MAEAQATLTFELVSPEKLLFSSEVEMVVVPGVEGDFGVLPQHAPLISTVRPGIIDIYEAGKISRRIFVAGGFAEVTGTRCTVLAEAATPLDEIDRAGVEERLRSAESGVKDASSDAERAAAEAEKALAEIMLEAVTKG